MGAHRVGVRCRQCHWISSRGHRADGAYGACPRCGTTLYVQVRRRHLQLARAFALEASAPVECGRTWPELVAAELERRERAMSETSSRRVPDVSDPPGERDG